MYNTILNQNTRAKKSHLNHTLLIKLVTILNLNAIFNSDINTSNEHYCIPKSRQWTRCNNMKKYIITKLILLEKHPHTWGKPCQYSYVHTLRPRRAKGTKQIQITLIIMTSVMAM